MAIWQFDLHLLPNAVLSRHYPERPRYLGIEEFDEVDWWAGVSVPKEAIAALDKSIPRAKDFWIRSGICWGEENGDKIEIVYEGKAVEWIFVRFDVRDIDLDFVAVVIEFASLIPGCFYLMEQKCFLDPDIDNLLVKISSSNAMSFVKDPNAHLEKLRKLNRGH